MNQAQTLLTAHLTELGIEFITEYQFAKHLGRKFAFDFYFPEHGMALEVEGGISKHEKFHPEWTKQRHQRADGMIRDMEKYNLAASLGFRIFRFTTESVLNGDAKKFLASWLKVKAECVRG